MNVESGFVVTPAKWIVRVEWWVTNRIQCVTRPRSVQASVLKKSVAQPRLSAEPEELPRSHTRYVPGLLHLGGCIGVSPFDYSLPIVILTPLETITPSWFCPVVFDSCADIIWLSTSLLILCSATSTDSEQR